MAERMVTLHNNELDVDHEFVKESVPVFLDLGWTEVKTDEGTTPVVEEPVVVSDASAQTTVADQAQTPSNNQEA